MATATTTVGVAPARGSALRYWKLYVSAFLLIWLVLVTQFGFWDGVRHHWPMSLVMIAGSLVAGSTPMGGGTVAFPILVLVFGQNPSNARNFGLIIQALGMTSAMIFMIGRRVPIPVRILIGSTAGAAIGFGIGTFLIGPHVRSGFVKLLFSCLWMSFGLLTLLRNSEICGLKGRGPGETLNSELSGLAAGLVGGIMASMIGVGVEMAVYTLMVLVYRTDLKIAIPTAVSAAALASILGAALHIHLGDIDSDSLYNWMAAGPIVIFGAPTGTFLMSKLPRIKVLYFVSALCVFQFIWTLQQTAHTRTEWLFAAGAMLVAACVLFVLYQVGKRREVAVSAAAA